MSLDTDAALVITRAQNMLSGVKQMFPTISPAESPEAIKIGPDAVVAEVLWLLGRKIPRLARAGRVRDAESRLVFAQGMLFGKGAISRHDLFLITDYAPASRPPLRADVPTQPEMQLIDAKGRVYFAQYWLRTVWKDPKKFQYAEAWMVDAATLIDDGKAQEAFVCACDEYVRLGVMWNRDPARYLQPRD